MPVLINLNPSFKSGPAGPDSVLSGGPDRAAGPGTDHRPGPPAGSPSPAVTASAFFIRLSRRSRVRLEVGRRSGSAGPGLPAAAVAAPGPGSLSAPEPQSEGPGPGPWSRSGQP